MPSRTTPVLSLSKHGIVACLVFALAAGATRADTLVGAWCGIGEQHNPNGDKSHWSIRLQLTEVDGLIEYPSLDCGGTLTFERSEGSARLLRERITWGRERCLDNGLVAVERMGAALRWSWTGLDRGAEIKALATLTADCEQKGGSSAALSLPMSPAYR